MKFWWRFALNYFLLAVPPMFVTAWVLNTFWPRPKYTGGNNLGYALELYGELAALSNVVQIPASYVLAKYWVF